MNVAVTDLGKLKMLSSGCEDCSSKPKSGPGELPLTFRKIERQWRSAASLLYQSEATLCVLERLEVEVESGRLTLKSDLCVESDVGLKQRLMDMLFCYNTVWLKLGLEVGGTLHAYVCTYDCVYIRTIRAQTYVHVHVCIRNLLSAYVHT